MKNLFRSLAFFGLSFVFGIAGALAVVSQVEFTDVDYDSWYGDSVNRFVKLGILQGYEDNTYRPNEYVNRAELAVILDRYMSKVEKQVVGGNYCIYNDTIYLPGEGYLENSCNVETCQSDGTFAATEMACQNPYGKFTNSWEQ